MALALLCRRARPFGVEHTLGGYGRFTLFSRARLLHQHKGVCVPASPGATWIAGLAPCKPPPPLLTLRSTVRVFFQLRIERDHLGRGVLARGQRYGRRHVSEGDRQHRAAAAEQPVLRHDGGRHRHEGAAVSRNNVLSSLPPLLLLLVDRPSTPWTADIASPGWGGPRWL